jgi:hypothetical protein
MSNKLTIGEQIEILKKEISRERIRVNRLVQVLRNNLPQENLQKKVNFAGIDCSGRFRYWNAEYDGMTLDDFLRVIVDP